MKHIYPTLSFSNWLSRWAALLLISLTVVSAPTTSWSQNSNPTTAAQGYNIFVKNSFTVEGGQCQGPIAMGGNLVLKSGYTAAQSSGGTFKSSNLAIGLLIGGGITYTNGSSFYVNNGYVKLGSGTGSSVWYKDNNNNTSANLQITSGTYNSNPKVQLQTSAANLGVSSTVNPVVQSGLIDFNAAFNKFQSFSAYMSTYTTKVTLKDPNGNALDWNNLPQQVKIYLASGVNVLNISGTNLNKLSSLTFDNISPDATRVLVVNVDAAGTYNWNVWNQNGSININNTPYVIYNFYNTTTLNLTGSNIEGTLFAPYADINLNNSLNIDGQVIGQSFYQKNGTINIANFNYGLPDYCTGVGSTTNASICSGSSYVFNGITYTTSGTYTKVLTSSLGCDSTATLVLKVNVLPTVKIDSIGAFTSCNTGVTLTASGAKTYLWSNNATTAAINPTAGGTFTVTGTDSNGCTATASKLLTTFSYPTTTTLSLTSMCSDTPSARLQWRVTNNNSIPVPFTWVISGTSIAGSEIAPANSQYFYFSTRNPGANTMLISYFTQTCAAASTSKASGLNACAPNVSGSITASTCNGSNGSIELTVSGGAKPYSYAWSNGGTAQKASTLTAGTYTVTVKSTLTNAQTVVNFTVVNTGTPTSSTTIATIPSGKSYSFGGNQYSAAGIYSVVLQNTTNCDSTATLILSVTPADQYAWTGTTSNSWSDPANWNSSSLPDNTISVTIPTSAGSFPIVDGTTSIKNLYIDSAAKLTVTGTLKVAGTITNNKGTLDVTNGTIEFNGTSAQTIAPNVFTGNTVKNFTINNAAGLSITDSLKITGTLQPTQGTLATGGLLVMKSNVNGTARIAEASYNNYLSGNVTVERFITPKTGRKYSFVATPIAQTVRESWQQNVYVTGAGTGGTPCGNTTGNGILPTDKYNSNGFDKTVLNAPSLLYYNATPVNGSRWVSVATTNDTLVPGRGYKLNVRGDRNSKTADCNNQINSSYPKAPEEVTLRNYGKANMGDITVNINDTALNKFTLLGNPYPCPISFASFYAANPHLKQNLWTYSPFNNGNYTTYSKGLVAYAAQGFDDASIDMIAIGQAFFVEAADNLPVKFKESHKGNGTIPNTQYFGGNNSKIVRIEFFGTGSTTRLDEAIARFNSFGSNTYNRDWDAISLGGSTQTLAAMKGSVKLAIATFGDGIIGDTIPLSVNSGTTGGFTLNFSNFSGIDSNISIVLRDKFIGTEQSIRSNPVYGFNITNDSLSKGNGRFELVFRKGATLPVVFKTVAASASKKGADIVWTVANETNLKGYIVERSLDAKNFEAIGSVNATAQDRYTLADSKLPSTNGKVYYRIKTMEAAGQSMYSNLVALTTEGNQQQLTIYPNPVKDKLNVFLPAGQSYNGFYTATLFSNDGKAVLTAKGISGRNGQLNIGAQALTSGQYILVLTSSEGTIWKEKVVKE